MIDYKEDWLLKLLFQLEGSLALRASFWALPAGLLAVGLNLLDRLAPDWREVSGADQVGGSTTWSSITVVLVFLIGFRTRQGLSRFWEGTGLLHQMRGEWFDTVSNCVTFSIIAAKTKPEEVKRFRHTLVRLMSLCHATALEEISFDQFQCETIDVSGLDNDTMVYLQSCIDVYHFNKVEVLVHLIQSLIVKSLDLGIITVPPPILSRVFQTLSRGFVNLLNTKKITDTKFPFPLAQLITALLIANMFMTPLMMSAAVENPYLVFVFAFVPIFGLSNLNFVASELENPFGKDANDLPLEHFQYEMNNCLLMLLHPDADRIATTSHCCILDFEQLRNVVQKEEHHAKKAKPKHRSRFDIGLSTHNLSELAHSKHTLDFIKDHTIGYLKHGPDSPRGQHDQARPGDSQEGDGDDERRDSANLQSGLGSEREQRDEPPDAQRQAHGAREAAVATGRETRTNEPVYQAQVVDTVDVDLYDLHLEGRIVSGSSTQNVAPHMEQGTAGMRTKTANEESGRDDAGATLRQPGGCGASPASHPPALSTDHSLIHEAAEATAAPQRGKHQERPRVPSTVEPAEEPEAKGGLEVKTDVQLRLMQSMEHFNQSLQAWTSLIESQVNELSGSFGNLSELRGSIVRVPRSRFTNKDIQV